MGIRSVLARRLERLVRQALEPSTTTSRAAVVAAAKAAKDAEQAAREAQEASLGAQASSDRLVDALGNLRPSDPYVKQARRFPALLTACLLLICIAMGCGVCALAPYNQLSTNQLASNGYRPVDSVQLAIQDGGPGDPVASEPLSAQVDVLYCESEGRLQYTLGFPATLTGREFVLLLIGAATFTGDVGASNSLAAPSYGMRS